MRESPITPTVGRIVLFRSNNQEQMGNGALEVPAIVTRVWGQNCINVQVMRDSASPLWLTSVLYADGEPGDGQFGWRWMPYQVAKAAETIET